MSWGKSIDRVDAAEREYRQACETHGVNSPEAKAADQKADAEEARHMREHNKPFLSY
ncbi:hypothetical protein [Streptomyces sp. NPDC126514]|uniref:hypothetical protein n=1 Tax=Streptomyces sp. NPDC126514 TaxID=3155210 RepID=UPI00332B260C